MPYVPSSLRKRKSPGQPNEARRNRLRVRPCLEELESRELLTAGLIHPDFIIESHGGAGSTLTPFGPPRPNGGPGGYGYTPAQIAHAYGIDQVSFGNGTIPANGAGTTIAIVDAYDQPNIVSDLHQFDQAFGLPDPPSFTKLDENGGTNYPPPDPGGWGVEISLDVEWAHAIAPMANIVLVEANPNSFGDILIAEQTAAAQPGVVAVSNSWGVQGEIAGETAYDSAFTTPAGHSPETFFVSSGDYGAPPAYPATSPNVVSVGGTTLQLDANNNIAGESGWSGSGGGPSIYETQPAYQNGTVTQQSLMRANPDVAYDSDPNTGFPVYDSNYSSSSPWMEVGGTSDASPQWAGILAIADQGRAVAGLTALDGPTQTLPTLYQLRQDFNDITTGASLGSPTYGCGPGYDYVTGLGTPQANKLIPDLAGSSSNGGGGGNNNVAVALDVTAPATVTAGSPFTLTVSAVNQSGAVVGTYTGTVQFSSTDLSAALPGPSTFATADAGAQSFTPVVCYTAGPRTITVTDTADGLTGSVALTVLPAAIASWSFIQQPLDVYAGKIMSPAVSFGFYDQFGNLETDDNSGTVSIAIANNPSNGILSGARNVPIVGGVATFSNLTISAPGARYSLVASTAGQPSLTSAAFTVSAWYEPVGNYIETFENVPAETWYAGGGSTGASAASYAEHDGLFGLDIYGTGWIYRTDAAATVKAGDQLSAWVLLCGPTTRAYLGFGASANGTLALVAAPNTNQLMLMYSPHYSTFTTLAAVSYANFQPYVWYRLQVNWSTTGSVTGRLYNTNGTLVLTSVTASVKSTGITSGGIAFRAIGNDAYFDTIVDTPNMGGGTSGGSTGAFIQRASGSSTSSTSAVDYASLALADYLAKHRELRITIPIVPQKAK
jgi:hypothetical protein